MKTINDIRTATKVLRGVAIMVMLAAGAFAANAQLGDDRVYKCSDETLSGRYAGVGHGFAAIPPAAPVPFASISLLSFDGAGSVTNKVTRSNNGVISRSEDSGTYTVNEDCTGSMVIGPLTFDLVIADLQGSSLGREFYFIATRPGGVVTSLAKKIQ